MKADNIYFASLVETRVLLEIQSAKLAALRRTNQDVLDIKKAMDAYANKVKSGEQAVEEDLMFHLAIAEASKNPVLKSLLLIITPDVISTFLQLDICRDNHKVIVLDEHEIILEHIVAKQPDKAATAMRTHLKEVFEYSQRLKRQQGNGSSETH